MLHSKNIWGERCSIEKCKEICRLWWNTRSSTWANSLSNFEITFMDKRWASQHEINFISSTNYCASVDCCPQQRNTFDLAFNCFDTSYFRSSKMVNAYILLFIQSYVQFITNVMPSPEKKAVSPQFTIEKVMSERK